MVGEEERVRFYENVGLQGWKGEVVTQFLDLVDAAAGRVEDFENDAWGGCEKCIPRHGLADGHGGGIVKSLLASAKHCWEFEIAAGGETRFSGKLVYDHSHEIYGSVLVVEDPAGHGIFSHTFVPEL